MISILTLAPVFAMVFAVAGCSCNEINEPTLSFGIVTQPKGGQNVQTLSCSYNVSFSPMVWKVFNEQGTDPDITLRVSWMNDKGEQSNVADGIFDQSSPSGTVYKTTKTTGQPNQYFNNTYWARFQWHDENGDHDVTSEKAVCTVK